MNEENKVSISRKNFANNLKNLRELKGKRISDVSRETGIAYSYLCNLENETEAKNPSFKTIDLLAEYYEIEPYILFL